MTSMIDVVFLLLIFFLVTTTFLKPEQQLMSAIKVNETDSRQSRSELEPAIVDVFLNNQKINFRVAAISTSRLSEIEEVLKLFENKQDGAFVRVADEVPFEAAAQVIAACRSAGFSSVSYLPMPSE